MISNITLTSSMRSNLSSLKSLASQMSTTQTRLSTGKKVNNAIDNANSYYQSRALTNRASDLDMLLDSMGQSIQTVTTAVHGLEKSAEMLENAAVIAQDAYEAAIIPEKAWFEAQVGPNGAVVTSAQELKDAINANKEMICVYGKIDYFENQTLAMKANQKLVGTEYFTGYTGNKKFSEINFKGTHNMAITTANNCLISDLSLNFDSSAENKSLIFGGGNFNNLDIEVSGTKIGGQTHGVFCCYSCEMTISGHINVKSSGGPLFSPEMGKINITEDAVVNAKLSYAQWGSAIVYTQSELNIYGKLNVASDSPSLWGGAYQYSGNKVNIYDGAEVTLITKGIRLLARKDENIYNTLNIEAGAKINLKDNNGEAKLISNGYSFENNTTSEKYIYSTTLASSGNFTPSGATVDWNNFANAKIGVPADEKVLAQSSEQYATMMTAYDEMVADSNYQGINLLKGGKLTTMFNEDRTHSYTINGKDMSSNNIGIITREWVTKDDIAQSIKEIQNAMSSIRDEVAKLGNHLSIIETRMNFTDAMTDILQTGADNLVLADMNEESANYLALQTRNSLAVNALALAAQSNNAVLKLF